VAARRVEDLGARRRTEEPQDQRDLTIAPRLELRLHEPQIVLVEDLRTDEVGHG